MGINTNYSNTSNIMQNRVTEPDGQRLQRVIRQNENTKNDLLASFKEKNGIGNNVNILV